MESMKRHLWGSEQPGPLTDEALPFLQDRLYATLANKELTKKMSPTNAKALNTMRQRLRKHNPGYAEQMEKFRANPESEEEPDRCAQPSPAL